MPRVIDHRVDLEVKIYGHKGHDGEHGGPEQLAKSRCARSVGRGQLISLRTKGKRGHEDFRIYLCS